MFFKYFSEQCLNYLNKVYDITTVSISQRVLSYIGPTFWNTTLDTLNHAIKLIFEKFF